jgi:hypothetical protein
MQSRARAYLSGLSLALPLLASGGCRAAPWKKDFDAFKQERAGEWNFRSRDVRHRWIELKEHGEVLPGWHDDIATARAVADQLVASYAGLLGIDGLKTSTRVAGKMGNTYAVVYRLSHTVLGQGEIPILGARVDVRIHQTGKLMLLASEVEHLAAAPQNPLGQPDAEGRATAFVGLVVAQDADDHRKTRLVYRRLGRAESAELAWEVPVSSWHGVPRQFGHVYVPAAPGHKPEFVSGVVSVAAGTGSIPSVRLDAAPLASTCGGAASGANVLKGWCRTGFAANSSVELKELANVHVYDGTGVNPAATTAVNGGFNGVIAVPSVTLAGAHCGKVVGSNPPVLTVNGADWVLGSDADPLQLAHVTAYWWIEMANTRVRPLLPTTPEVAASLADLSMYETSVNEDCMSGSTTCPAGHRSWLLYFPKGDQTVPNRAFSTIILHEWGHALDYVLSDTQRSDGLGEGWADVVAMYVSGQPCVGLGYAGDDSCLRTYDPNATYQSGADEYAMSLSWSGFAWTLRSKLIAAYGADAGSAWADRLVLGTIFTNMTSQAEAANEVLLAARQNDDPSTHDDIVAMVQESIDQHRLWLPKTL